MEETKRISGPGDLEKAKGIRGQHDLEETNGICRLEIRDIGAKPNLYSEAIELVFGGSPIGCVLVERKAQHRGKLEQQQHRTSLDQLLVQHKCTVVDKMNGNYLQLPYSSLQESRHR